MGKKRARVRARARARKSIRTNENVPVCVLAPLQEKIIR